MINAIQAKDTLSNDIDLTLKDRKYKKFYMIMDQLVHEIKEHVSANAGEPKRRCKGDGLGKLYFSVKCLAIDCVTAVYGTKRVGEANLISLTPCQDILGL